MADSIVVLDHRHARGGNNGLDERVTATGDDHIHVLIHRRHDFHGLTILGGDELNGTVWQSRSGTASLERRGNRKVRRQGLRPAPQDHRIAGLETQDGSIGRYIRTGFVDDSDDADRGADFGNFDAIRTSPAAQDFAHGVVETGHLPDAGGHIRNALFREPQTINRRAGQPGFFGSGGIQRISI